jgi:ParB-like chromosome segregation protein Spo0J
MARNMFRVCSVNRAAYEAALSTVEAILREGSDDNIERSDLVDNGGKETLLLLEMF